MIIYSLQKFVIENALRLCVKSRLFWFQNGMMEGKIHTGDEKENKICN